MAGLKAVLSFYPARPRLAGSLGILSIPPLTRPCVAAHDREMTTDPLGFASYDGRPRHMDLFAGDPTNGADQESAWWNR